MTKVAESLTAKLRDVARAFCLEVWGQALSTTGVSIKSELRAPDKVYYPPALCLAPTLPQPPSNPSSAPPSSSNQPAPTPFAAFTKDKEQEQAFPADVVDVEAEKITEAAQLKRKKKEKEPEKKGEKGKETSV